MYNSSIQNTHTHFSLLLYSLVAFLRLRRRLLPNHHLFFTQFMSRNYTIEIAKLSKDTLEPLRIRRKTQKKQKCTVLHGLGWKSHWAKMRQISKAVHLWLCHNFSPLWRWAGHTNTRTQSDRRDGGRLSTHGRRGGHPDDTNTPTHRWSVPFV